MMSPDSSHSRTKGSVGAVVKAAGGEDLRRMIDPSFVVMGVGRFAPDAGEPRLLFERQAGGAVKMGELDKSRGTLRPHLGSTAESARADCGSAGSLEFS
jgi:hypothetical protein